MSHTTKQNFLLGYVRTGPQMTPIFSQSPVISVIDPCIEGKESPREISGLRYHESLVVPLDLRTDQTFWILSKDSIYVKGPLKQILNDGAFFITASEKKSSFFLLMHPRSHNHEMCRGGILLHENKDGLSPVTVNIEGDEYLVDMKGSGSPVGMWPSTHLRSVAPGFSAHIRVTGALTYDGALKEFEHAESIREVCEKKKLVQHHRMLGVIDYTAKFDDYKDRYGLVLRLSPSNIRCSYSGSSSIKKVNTIDLDRFSYFCGQQTALLLENEDYPLVHEGMNFNNMVVVNQEDYMISDFEETSKLGELAWNLDFPQHIMPEMFHFRYFRHDYFPAFLKGLKSFPGRIQNVLENNNPQDILDCDAILFKHVLSVPIFRDRYINSVDISPLEKNRDLILDYLPKTYFDMPAKAWVGSVFRVDLKEKQCILDVYRQFAFEFGFEALQHGIRGVITDLSQEFLKRVTLVCPEYERYIKPKPMSPPDNGKYCLLYHYNNKFIDEPKSGSDLEEIGLQCEALIEEVDVYLKTDEIDLSCVDKMDYWGERKAVHFASLTNNIYPFFCFITNHFQNERRILNDVLYHKDILTEKEVAIAEKSMAELEKRRHILHRSPEQVKDWLGKDQERFTDFLVFPYYRV